MFVHATTVCIGERGLLIRGAPGSGKSTLALSLLNLLGAAGRHAALVADDQTGLYAAGGALIARANPRLGNAIERAGLGIVRVPAVPACRVSLVVDLVPEHEVPRLPEAACVRLLGIELPQLFLAARQSEVACLTLAAALHVDGTLRRLPDPPGPKPADKPVAGLLQCLDGAPPPDPPSAPEHGRDPHVALWRVS